VTLEFILDGGLIEFHCILSFSLFCAPGSFITLPYTDTPSVKRRPNLRAPAAGITS
jgi:hypothetical protein